MKTKLFLISLYSLIALSCGQKEETSSHEVDNNKTEVNLIRKPIAFNGTFYSITNLGSINIIYTQGPHSIEFEGDSMMMRS